jgi:hypothetical protein
VRQDADDSDLHEDVDHRHDGHRRNQRERGVAARVARFAARNDARLEAAEPEDEQQDGLRPSRICHVLCVEHAAIDLENSERDQPHQRKQFRHGKGVDRPGRLPHANHVHRGNQRDRQP